eukprot:TRINITY_DN25427_c0_g1_i1.p1 TRINITY_DN25427_c0_g1~~TRINITY_DN25427_c0_g1_i1.p1  ORF type:complete len:1907 (-),score=273.59 TRINITY_DN25427_c0_g1_i1:257-5833(-)
MESRNQVSLCHALEPDLRELATECHKKFPVIKEYADRSLSKLRAHRDTLELDEPAELPEFPLEDVMRAIQMACETFQPKLVLLSIACLQRLIHRRMLKDDSIATAIKLMKEQATTNDDSVQLKVLQTIMATPADMTLVNDLVAEHVMQLLYVLHNSASASVHHTACACFRQLAEHLADQAADALGCEKTPVSPPPALGEVVPSIQRGPASIPSVSPSPAPATLPGAVRIFYMFVQDLCVMADYDASSQTSRYVVDANERMKTGYREGFWLNTVKFPRPLCLELLAACVSARPEIFMRSPECFALMRHNVCGVLFKNLKGCFDFAVLVRSIHVLQQIMKFEPLANLLSFEFQMFLNLMLDLTSAERSSWQRATSLEFLKSVCEDPTALSVLHKHEMAEQGTTTFLELVNSLSKMMHQVCFSSGMDSGALLQSAAGGASVSSSASERRSGSSNFEATLEGAALLRGGAALLGKTGLLCASGFPGLGGNALGTASGGSRGAESTGGAAGRQSTGGSGSRARLLLLMSEAEPPTIQPSFLVLLVVECVFAIVSTLYSFLAEDGGREDSAMSPKASRSNGSASEASPPTDGRSKCSLPLTEALSSDQIRCRDMLTDCWASLLSALSLLLHGTADEAFLRQTLRCLQTLLYCCSRLSLDQARDACLLQLTRYTLPGQSHEAENDTNVVSGTPGNLSTKNCLCFRALLSFCYSFGALLGVAGWEIALRAVTGLERLLAKAPAVQGGELGVLRGAVDALFETTVVLPERALIDIVDAIGKQSIASDADTSVAFGKLTALCKFNASRLLPVWDRVVRLILNISASQQDYRAELRGAAAAALCRILTPALRKGTLSSYENPEDVQRQLLEPLEELLRVPHEDVRARVCEGLLSILQAYGQELFPAAWDTTIRLVTAAAQLELERNGVEFHLPADISLGCGIKDGTTGRELGKEGNASSVVQTIFQLLELLVHDFMEYVPISSVPSLIASIGAFGRFNGLGVNSSLTAVGFLWNVADALARYQSGPLLAVDADTNSAEANEASNGGKLGSQESICQLEDLWIKIFTHLRVLAVDSRPEVRNSAVKSLTSALISHGRKVGTRCYQRCLRDILVKVLSDIDSATTRAREGTAQGDRTPSSSLIVHHSRNSVEKLWSETMVLGLEGVRRVLSHFAEESEVEAFAPLAYTLLLQIQELLHTLNPEVSGAAFKALIDLMRISASSKTFDGRSVIAATPALPVPTDGITSVWSLGWSVLWQMTRFCLTRDVSESLMETFVSALSALRNSHRKSMSVGQGMIVVEMMLVLVTSPSFFVSSCQPLERPQTQEDSKPAGSDFQGLETALASAINFYKGCAEQAACTHDDAHVFQSMSEGPEVLFDLLKRSPDSSRPLAYSKAVGPIKNVVDENKSRSSDIKGAGDALVQIQRNASAADCEGKPEDVHLQFLGPPSSPTHRTLLHISSARLQHVQGIVFGHLEETPELVDPSFIHIFLARCCAIFLNMRYVLLDTNKLALASRTLCLIILFCRRVVIENLSAKALGRKLSPSGGQPERHVEALISAIPMVCKIVASFACAGKGIAPAHISVGIKSSGIWKIAVEALLYMIEDTLPVLESGCVSAKVASAYWDVVLQSLEDLVLKALPEQTCPVSEFDMLVQAIANLMVHKLFACSLAPKSLQERMVRLLAELAALQRNFCPAETHSPTTSVLGNLFDICGSRGKVSEEEDSEALCVSAAALAARGPEASLRSPVRVSDRELLLRVAAPLLLERARETFASYVEISAQASDNSAQCQRYADQVLFVLSRLRDFRADDLSLVAASPALPGDQARSACRLAGTRAFALALLPQLASLVNTGDARIAAEVREILQGVAGALGL